MNQGFADECLRWGPEASYSRPSLPLARAYCKRLAASHYENFTVASFLLPRRLLPHFHAIYAYCRWADDLGDETGGGQRALDLLAWWREQLLACYANYSPPFEGEGGGVGVARASTPPGPPFVRGGEKIRHPVMVALLPTIQRFAIPPDPFLDLLTAFEQDQRVKRYETFDQLLDYCRCSANPVGRLVLYLCEAFEKERAALSDQVCTGLQLANFWQDVARDLDMGRVYLPAEDRRRFGYADDDLEARRFTPAFAELMRFEIQRARRLLNDGLPLVSLMPADVQIDIDLFIHGGLAILRKIEAVGYNVWQTRPRLSKLEKAKLLGVALWRKIGRCSKITSD